MRPAPRGADRNPPAVLNLQGLRRVQRSLVGCSHSLNALPIKPGPSPSPSCLPAMQTLVEQLEGLRGDLRSIGTVFRRTGCVANLEEAHQEVDQATKKLKRVRHSLQYRLRSARPVIAEPDSDEEISAVPPCRRTKPAPKGKGTQRPLPAAAVVRLPKKSRRKKKSGARGSTWRRQLVDRGWGPT
eukprot:EG_transcript_28805